MTDTLLTDEHRWTALVARDAAADGTFYYSVRTTGVYCRPSCASRRPRRENVAFHATTVEAERAGFRPCRRVRERLATGSSTATVTDAIYEAGFNSNGRFYATSSATLGMTPTDFRAGGRGTAIRFGVGECTLGSVLVAATDAGVCAIFLGDDPDALVHELEDRFPTASLTGGDARFEAWMSAVVALVDDPRVGLDLPLDVRGTAFQQRVWQALRAIPVGSTASYSEIAAAIGAPKAVRAVAAACAANALAVAIPCHRVVRTDGSLSGYRWGVERKRLLLDRETTPPG
jgi:AraC family transcriptional regulator, regulatory protein of adaptative response / methylated-DNA-[protein]-cysteine methyltransferase